MARTCVYKRSLNAVLTDVLCGESIITGEGIVKQEPPDPSPVSDEVPSYVESDDVPWTKQLENEPRPGEQWQNDVPRGHTSDKENEHHGPRTNGNAAIQTNAGRAPDSGPVKKSPRKRSASAVEKPEKEEQQWKKRRSSMPTVKWSSRLEREQLQLLEQQREMEQQERNRRPPSTTASRRSNRLEPIKMFKCGGCSMVFKSREAYMSHNFRYKARNVAEYHCSLCNGWFRTIERLQQHGRCSSDISEYTFECTFCVKRFAAPSMLQTHMFHLHKDLIDSGVITILKLKNNTKMIIAKKLYKNDAAKVESPKVNGDEQSKAEGKGEQSKEAKRSSTEQMEATKRSINEQLKGSSKSSSEQSIATTERREHIIGKPGPSTNSVYSPTVNGDSVVGAGGKSTHEQSKETKKSNTEQMSGTKRNTKEQYIDTRKSNGEQLEAARARDKDITAKPGPSSSSVYSLTVNGDSAVGAEGKSTHELSKETKKGNTEQMPGTKRNTREQSRDTRKSNGEQLEAARTREKDITAKPGPSTNSVDSPIVKQSSTVGETTNNKSVSVEEPSTPKPETANATPAGNKVKSNTAEKRGRATLDENSLPSTSSSPRTGTSGSNVSPGKDSMETPQRLITGDTPTPKRMKQLTLMEFLQLSNKKKQEASSPAKPKEPEQAQATPKETERRENVKMSLFQGENQENEVPKTQQTPFVRIHADTALLMSLLNETTAIKTEPVDDVSETPTTPFFPYSLRQMPKSTSLSPRRKRGPERNRGSVKRRHDSRKRKKMVECKECFVPLVRCDLEVGKNAFTPKPTDASTRSKPPNTFASPKLPNSSTTPKPTNEFTTPKPLTRSTIPKSTNASTIRTPLSTSTTPNTSSAHTTPKPSNIPTTPKSPSASTTPNPSNTLTISKRLPETAMLANSGLAKDNSPSVSTTPKPSNTPTALKPLPETAVLTSSGSAKDNSPSTPKSGENKSSPSNVLLKDMEIPLVRLNSSSATPSASADKTNTTPKDKAECSVKTPSVDPFPCKDCTKSFGSKENLRAHVKLFHVAYMSSICDARYSSRGKLLRHYIREHTAFKRNKCCVCQESFRNSAVLKRHMVLHCIKTVRSDEDKFPVDVEVKCNTFRKHYQCPTCGKKFWLKSCLKQHQEAYHTCNGMKTRRTDSENAASKQVPKESDGPAQMFEPGQTPCGPQKRLVRRSLDVNPAIPEECRESSPNDSEEKMSQDKTETDNEAGSGNPIDVVDIDKAVYPCPICGNQFPTFLKLCSHLRNYSQPACDRCNICGTSFTNKRLLRGHINATHITSGVNKAYRFHCRFCNQGFTQKAYLQAHEMHFHSQQVDTTPVQTWRNSEQPWNTNTICAVCNLMFETYDRFVEHNMYYHNEHVFTCAFCNKSFRGMYMLHHHNKLFHYPEETRMSYPYTCQICNEGFNHESHFHAHKLHIHPNEPFDIPSFMSEVPERGYH